MQGFHFSLLYGRVINLAEPEQNQFNTGPGKVSCMHILYCLEPISIPEFTLNVPYSNPPIPFPPEKWLCATVTK